ncbi:MAG: DUF2480 family protein [Bacteroidetes bacterium]|nr:DUF2480 family protein [Bacteroidota bacterium]
MVVSGIDTFLKKDRENLKTHDWSQYKDKFVAVVCSATELVPRGRTC